MCSTGILLKLLFGWIHCCICVVWIFIVVLMRQKWNRWVISQVCMSVLNKQFHISSAVVFHCYTASMLFISTGRPASHKMHQIFIWDDHTSTSFRTTMTTYKNKNTKTFRDRSQLQCLRFASELFPRCFFFVCFFLAKLLYKNTFHLWMCEYNLQAPLKRMGKALNIHSKISTTLSGSRFPLNKENRTSNLS